MHVGFLIIEIIYSFIWTYKCTDAIPTVTLTASSSPYFDIGGSISFTCSINEDVLINDAYFTKDGEQYVWIQINSPSSCVLTPLTGKDSHVYSVTCEQRMKVHIVMNGTVATDHNATWTCDMSTQSGPWNPLFCVSTSSVTTALRVKVTSVQLTNGNGQPLVTPVPVLDGSSKVFHCDTSPNGSRPRALFNWYKRSQNQSPILIQGQSVSTPGPKPEVDLSMSISYSTLTLIGNRSDQNMYIYCKARDETNRGNFVKSAEAQINIVYPPVIQLYPNTSVFNVTEGLPKFVFTCNVADANPMPKADDYSWFHGGTVIQGQTRSSYELLNVQKSQDGVYQCMARNNYGTGNSSTLYINVQYGAEIINVSVTEGNTVNENTTTTLRCLVDSNPKSNITWTKQGILGVLQTNLSVHESQLIIENAECLDTSNYTCNARNGVGQPVERKIPLYVTCHPRTDFRSPSVTIVYSKRYGNASLNYTVISFPEPIFNWTFIGNGSESRLLPDSATKHDNGLQSVLIFTNLSITDFGFYKVIAKNMFPTSATEVFQLIPADVPDIPSNVTVTGVKQTSLTVQWLAGNDGGLKQTFHIIIKASDITRSVYATDPGYGKLGTQTIEDLIPNTEYSISMSANNSLGSSSVSNVIILLITLKDVPDIPSNVTVTDVKQTSLTVQWLAGNDGRLKQTFHIIIKASDITRSVYAPDPGYGKLGTQTIEDLIPNTEYSISMSANNSLGSSSVTNVIILITLKEGIHETLGIPVAEIAGGVSAAFVFIIAMGLGIFLWRSHHKKQNEDKNDVMREHKERSVRHDAVKGQEYEGLYLNRGEARPYLQLNDIRLEENRNANTRPPENDSYEKLHPYANTDIQMYSSLKIPKISKDSERMYENTQIR